VLRAVPFVRFEEAIENHPAGAGPVTDGGYTLW
jgi:hypothetical protein